MVLPRRPPRASGEARRGITQGFGQEGGDSGNSAPLLPLPSRWRCRVALHHSSLAPRAVAWLRLPTGPTAHAARHAVADPWVWRLRPRRVSPTGVAANRSASRASVHAATATQFRWPPRAL